MKIARRAALVVVLAFFPVLSACSDVCFAGMGDCHELNKFNDNNGTGGSGLLSLTLDQSSIWQGNQTDLRVTGGQSPYSYSIVSGPCQFLSQDTTGGVAVVEGTSRGACMLQVTDQNGLQQTTSLTVNGPT